MRGSNEIQLMLFANRLLLTTRTTFDVYFCERKILACSLTCRYVFSCNDWIKVRRDMSKRYAKALKLDSVEESHLTAVASTHALCSYIIESFPTDTDRSIAYGLYFVRCGIVSPQRHAHKHNATTPGANFCSAHISAATYCDFYPTL